MANRYKILTDPDQHSLENKNNEYYYVEDLIIQTPDGIIRVKGKYAVTGIKDYKGLVIVYNDHSIEHEWDVVNGSSIPWFGQWLIPKEGKQNRPSAPHDVGYEKAKIEYEIKLPVLWSNALDAFKAGSILPEYFGKEYHRVYGVCRAEEARDFHAQITNRDYEWYLRSV